MGKQGEVRITGTLMWYFHICKRQVWLMARQIVPDSTDQNLEIGRFLQETSYSRDRKEVSVGNMKFDLVRRENGKIVVGEVKKSSRFEKSATMQLALYMLELSNIGLSVSGELMFPAEKRKVKIELTPDLIKQVEKSKMEILALAYQEGPPLPEKNKYCGKCAYREMCWA